MTHYFTESTFLKQLAQHGQQFADDVAMVHDQLFTTDVLVEGTHFDWAYCSPADVGWKAVMVNASDIAATGGVLDGLLIALTLPNGTTTEQVDELYKGIQQACKTLPQAPAIWGGDTAKGPCWQIAITAIGHMPAGYSAGRRWQAQPGDRVITTGAIDFNAHGLSAVGLAAFQAQQGGYACAKQAHLRPVAQWQAGLQLAQTGCRYAMMDSSDGLADAAMKLANASHVSLALWADTLTPHPEVKQWANLHTHNPLDYMLYGGEDFQLVATWPPTHPLPMGWMIIGEVLACGSSVPQAFCLPHRQATLHEGTLLTMANTFQHFKIVT
jgi:thiamine-monophosphate kinase